MTQALPPVSVFSRRRAGVLLHPTALPGSHGKLGESARRFVDWLAAAGVTVWQTLPIGPTHPDLSPYQSLSAHAGNPELIDFRELPGKLESREIDDAWPQFLASHSHWLDDYALFVTIRARYPGTAWPDWPDPLRRRDAGALTEFSRANEPAIEQVKYEQFLFHRQWHALREYARDRGVLMFGDIPIFVAHDSADVWANPEQFKLDANGQPLAVAGVPPDYFSPDGQHWGNPLYNWQAMARDGYRWWLSRLASQREKFDLLRIDHFRGLQAFWEIPASDPRPVNGYWVPGPGDDFLSACFRELPDLPLVAENLGIIGDDVEQLRHRFRLPGMTVLQFGFDGSPGNPHLLHNHRAEDLVYTGTHDNDTTLGWYHSLDEHTRQHVNHYLRITGEEAAQMPWPIIQAAMGSVSGLVVVPVQDLLGLGSDARFNTPGTIENNWIWQLPEHYQELVDIARLRETVQLYGR